MKNSRLNKLFELARAETAPVPPPDFAADVLRAVRREPSCRPAGTLPVFEQLNGWFPRIAVAAAALMLLCVAADFGLTAAGMPELGDSVSQASAQLFFSVEEL